MIKSEIKYARRSLERLAYFLAGIWYCGAMPHIEPKLLLIHAAWLVAVLVVFELAQVSLGFNIPAPVAVLTFVLAVGSWVLNWRWDRR